MAGGIYSRNIDIGKPGVAIPVDVESFVPVVSAIETATAKIEESTEELKKIALGTGLVTGVDLDEEKIDG